MRAEVSDLNPLVTPVEFGQLFQTNAPYLPDCNLAGYTLRQGGRRATKGSTLGDASVVVSPSLGTPRAFAPAPD